MYGINGMSWGMGFGWIFGIAVLAIMIWLIVRVVGTGNNPQKINYRSALDILKDRYARGEIGKDEFEEIKKSVT